MSLLFLMSMITIALSLSFARMLHPLAMGLTLLFQTVVICITSGLATKSMWFSYILFLIFLGAMLVLFIYVASLASNEAFTLSLTLISISLLTIFLGSLFWLLDPLLLSLKTSIESSFIETSQFLFSTQSILSTIYNPTSANLTLFIILYLLLTLIVVVKITSTFFGPLRLS
uniref:NADH-ubiquinone oxidoreductase chain 6 n=1 Tax=Nautilocaris saintlaurentae TaxID=1378109 RepID=S5RF30_9EUCA|nr:NADH dehydrogenase subunit 6 [Nautilocaris saintlaurentae]AGS12715.1 NADH dehydrogenase subunit 6 [Nautilocaris saintlaurentae]